MFKLFQGKSQAVSNETVILNSDNKVNGNRTSPLRRREINFIIEVIALYFAGCNKKLDGNAKGITEEWLIYKQTLLLKLLNKMNYNDEVVFDFDDTDYTKFETIANFYASVCLTSKDPDGDSRIDELYWIFSNYMGINNIRTSL